MPNHKKIKRILIINYEYPPLGGGGGVACQQIAVELAKTVQVDVLTGGFKGLPSHEVDLGVNVYRVPVLLRKNRSVASFLSMLSYFPSSLIHGWLLLKKENYDLVNTWFVIPSGLTGQFLSRWKGIPNVLTIIGGDIYDPTKSYSPHRNPVLHWVVQRLLEAANGKTAISLDTKKRALEHYKVKTEINVIPLGIKEPSFSYASRADLGFSEEDFLLVSVGRLVPRKGYSILLDAVSKLPHSNLKVIIIGDGPCEHDLKGQAIRLGIVDRVKFMGFISDKKKFQILAVSDCFVLPSLHEGFGLVFLEAMVCGLPVVTTNNGGQSEFLRDGKTGFLIPVDNTELLVERIMLLISDPVMREQMGSFNRGYSKQFLIQETANQYLDLFEKTLSAGSLKAEASKGSENRF